MGTTPEGGIYGIGAVASMLGVPAGPLRTWEERYAVFAVPRLTPMQAF